LSIEHTAFTHKWLASAARKEAACPDAQPIGLSQKKTEPIFDS
jgi:hypothetical protein